MCEGLGRRRRDRKDWGLSDLQRRQHLAAFAAKPEASSEQATWLNHSLRKVHNYGLEEQGQGVQGGNWVFALAASRAAFRELRLSLGRNTCLRRKGKMRSFDRCQQRHHVTLGAYVPAACSRR